MRTLPSFFLRVHVATLIDHCQDYEMLSTEQQPNSSAKLALMSRVSADEDDAPETETETVIGFSYGKERLVELKGK